MALGAQGFERPDDVLGRDRAAIADGRVVYLGRTDDQINLGGARIEPSDVENVLLNSGLISAVIVTATDMRPLADLLSALPPATVADVMKQAANHDDPTREMERLLRCEGQPDLRLVAHVEHIGPLDTRRLREVAASALPSHMRPSIYSVHEQLPRTPNGKLDRAAAASFAILEQATSPQADAQPSRHENAIVKKLTELFRHELRDPEFSAQDSLFDRGGNSLSVIRLLMTIEHKFGTSLTTTALYDAPTPEQLSLQLRLTDEATQGAPIFVVPCDVGYSAPPPAFHLALSVHHPVQYLEHPGMRGGIPPIWTLAALAEIYVEEIEEKWPSGPILLGAFCIGAYVATEVAAQLAAKGRPITHLTLLDPSIPRLQVTRMAREAGQIENASAKTFAGRMIDLCDKVINSKLLLGQGYLRGDRKRSKALRGYGIYVSMRYLRRFNGAPEHLSLDYWMRGLMLAAASYDDLAPYLGKVDIVASEEHRPTLEGNPDFLAAILPHHIIHYVEQTHWDIGMTARTAECVSNCFERAMASVNNPEEFEIGLTL